MPLKDLAKRKAYARSQYDKKRDENLAKAKRHYHMNRDRIIATRATRRQRPGFRASACLTEKQRHAKLRAEIIEAFGGKCACCGEAEPHFLELDHIKNNGSIHRKEVGTSSPKVYKDVKRRGFPKDEFQLLCSNCNRGKSRNGGICPHESKKKNGR